MGGLIVLFVIGFFIFLAVVGGNAQTRALKQVDLLLQNGIPARGLILQVSSTGTNVAYGVQRYERRSLVIDIEVYGQAPYQVSAMPLIPKLFVRNVLPGTFVELRIDRSNPQNFAIVGPGSISFVG